MSHAIDLHLWRDEPQRKTPEKSRAEKEEKEPLTEREPDLSLARLDRPLFFCTFLAIAIAARRASSWVLRGTTTLNTALVQVGGVVTNIPPMANVIPLVDFNIPPIFLEINYKRD